MSVIGVLILEYYFQHYNTSCRVNIFLTALTQCTRQYRSLNSMDRVIESRRTKEDTRTVLPKRSFTSLLAVRGTFR